MLTTNINNLNFAQVNTLLAQCKLVTLRIHAETCGDEIDVTSFLHDNRVALGLSQQAINRNFDYLMRSFSDLEEAIKTAAQRPLMSTMVHAGADKGACLDLRTKGEYYFSKLNALRDPYTSSPPR